MIFDRLFQLMAERQASDIFVTSGAPIQIKINGNIVPINQQIMEPVVISGSLPKDGGRYSLYAAVIVKRVDAQTRSKTSINELLRA